MGQLEPLSVFEARLLAVRAHGEQCDRDGTPHIVHVARVADLARGPESRQRVAWLHDVIEDTDVDRDDLRRRLREPEWEALMLLTHDDEAVSYDAYVEAIAAADGEAGELARAVKEADIRDNLRRCVEARDPAIGQYGAALARLWTVQLGG